MPGRSEAEDNALMSASALKRRTKKIALTVHDHGREREAAIVSVAEIVKHAFLPPGCSRLQAEDRAATCGLIQNSAVSAAAVRRRAVQIALAVEDHAPLRIGAVRAGKFMQHAFAPSALARGNLEHDATAVAADAAGRTAIDGRSIKISSRVED